MPRTILRLLENVHGELYAETQNTRRGIPNGLPLPADAAADVHGELYAETQNTRRGIPNGLPLPADAAADYTATAQKTIWTNRFCSTSQQCVPASTRFL
ncbi:hypothetical protein QE152_g4526 [Popillia japonica]|uniref:Uncharacterized protein n=1 Tax=Popillia japonica TaxID=7064 RepID=A0AAW1N2F4_POPJA